MKSILVGALILLACATSWPTPLARECVVAGEVCFPIRVAVAGFSPEQRVARVNERLAYILGNETCQPATIQAVPVGGDVKIVVGRTLLVTVTKGDATAAGTKTAAELASVWVANLRLALPAGRCIQR